MFPKAVATRMGRTAAVAIARGGVLLALGGVAAPVAQAEPPGMCMPGMPCGPGGPGGPGGFGGPGGPGGFGPGPGGPVLGPVGSFLSDLCILPIVCPPH